MNYFFFSAPVAVSKNKVIQMGGSKFKDSGGGFLIEERPPPQAAGDSAPPSEAEWNELMEAMENESENLPLEFKQCLECNGNFVASYLMQTFDYPVCDACRDNEDKHSLITRTEAKNEYLLKDCDLDKREPLLKTIIKKNPHNPRWGEMKLYLHVQIEKRALEVWGTEEALIEAKEERVDKREKSKAKKYSKQMKQLRMQVRSSLYDRTTAASHTHSFGPESYNEDDDTYSHDCEECGYSETFEKL